MFVFVIIGLMFGGALLGYILRSKKLNFIHSVITGLIWLLLFLLGVEVGDNKAIINGLHKIGFEALLITLFSVAGSILAAWGLWMYVRRNKQEDKL